MSAHSHTHAAARGGQRRRLTWVAAMVGGFMVVELAVGIWSGSLTLVSDAGHMASDALGLLMSLAAMLAAERVTISHERSFGLYRAEILAALANAVLLFGVAGYVLWEAAQRFQSPHPVSTGPVLLVGTFGLIINIVSWRILRADAEKSLNVKGAYLEIFADLLGSVGVIVSALIVWATGWNPADALIAAAIALFILPRAWSLARSAVRVLVQAAPEELDVSAIAAQLAGIDSVVDVHDLHVWTLTSAMNVASAHLMIRAGDDSHRVLDRARSILEGDHGISHATLQVEPDTHKGCAELTW